MLHHRSASLQYSGNNRGLCDLLVWYMIQVNSLEKSDLSINLVFMPVIQKLLTRLDSIIH